MAIKVKGLNVIDDTRNIVNANTINTPAVSYNYATQTGSGAISVDLAATSHHVINMTGDVTFTFSNAAAGQTGVIFLSQDASGGRTFTLPAIAKTPLGGATISQNTASSSTAILSYVALDASNVLVNYIGNFA